MSGSQMQRNLLSCFSVPLRARLNPAPQEDRFRWVREHTFRWVESGCKARVHGALRSAFGQVLARVRSIPKKGI